MGNGRGEVCLVHVHDHGGMHLLRGSKNLLFELFSEAVQSCHVKVQLLDHLRGEYITKM